MAASRSVRRLPIAAGLFALLLTACGQGVAPRAGDLTSSVEVANPTASSATSGAQIPEASPAFEPDTGSDPKEVEPPPVLLRYGARSATLAAYSYCFTGVSRGVCADGRPPEHPLDVGAPAEVVVEFPLDGWTFEAHLRPAGAKCGRDQPALVEPTGPHSFVLRPAGHAGTYDVDLFGRGKQGDLATAFRWTTPGAGPLQAPKARLALIAGDAGHIDSYGIELEASNLARTPETATAKITVTAANHRSIEFEPPPSSQSCLAEGTVYWTEGADIGRSAAILGPAPFTYDVVLTLDGRRYAAHARWPDDVIVGNEPSVKLEFTPSLPALR